LFVIADINPPDVVRHNLDVIRSARKDDAIHLAAIYAPYVRETVISFEARPPDEGEMASRIQASHAALVYEEAERRQGFAYAVPLNRRAAYRWSAEVSVYVAATAAGRGIGRQLLGALLDELRTKGLVNAFGGIALPNPRSVRLFEFFGFDQIALQKKVGYSLKAWHDVGWWQLQLREPPVPPPSLDQPSARA